MSTRLFSVETLLLEIVVDDAHRDGESRQCLADSRVIAARAIERQRCLEVFDDSWGIAGERAEDGAPQVRASPVVRRRTSTRGVDRSLEPRQSAWLVA